MLLSSITVRLRRFVLFMALVLVASAAASCTPERDPMDLRTAERTWLSNDALACPPDHCRAEADMMSPAFDVAAHELAAATRRAIQAQPRTLLLHAAEPGGRGQLVYQQRTPWAGFPDTIWIEFIPLDRTRSTLAVYSRSDYGLLWDFGTNRDRVERWLGAIAAEITTESDGT